nr:hypothetical protein CFP56_71910 [Quercus suber]
MGDAHKSALESVLLSSEVGVATGTYAKSLLPQAQHDGRESYIALHEILYTEPVSNIIALRNMMHCHVM